MSKNYKNTKEYKDPWYSLTANRLIVTLGPLRGEVNCDVCVVGAGFTGLSAALELVQKGLSVVLLEAGSVASGASGKNGGQLIRGFARTPGEMVEEFGLPEAKFMNNLSLEGLALILDRITTHEIICDLKFGHLTAAIKNRHAKALKQEIADWQKIGHDDLQYIDKKSVQDFVKTEKYIGGIFDPKGAHFHPLNYALGIADVAQRAGVKIYDTCPAREIVFGKNPKIITDEGKVSAKFIILAGPIQMKGLDKISKTAISATSHMIATEPLGEARARNLLAKDIAVSDANFIVNYYRLSSDYRLLFGGNCNYSARDYPGEDERLRHRMLQVFPSLKMTLIQHCWHGPLNFTINRMPNIGRLSPQVYYGHGFSGHGVIATNVLGKVLAEAVAGSAARFDVFAKIKHAPFPGGGLLKRPLFVLGMTWYKLRDLL